MNNKLLKKTIGGLAVSNSVIIYTVIILLVVSCILILNRPAVPKTNLSKVWMELENNTYFDRIYIKVEINGVEIYDDSVQGRLVKPIFIELKEQGNIFQARYNQYTFKIDTISAKSKSKEYGLTLSVSPTIVDGQAALRNVFYFNPYRSPR